MAKGKLKISEAQLEELLNDIYDGKITPNKLPDGLYRDIAKVLTDAVYHGYGGKPNDFGGVDLTLIQELRDNIYMFSAAKTFQQVREMSDALVDTEGVVPFSDFKKSAIEIFERYNGPVEEGGGEIKTGWLRSEYDTAIGQAQNAWKWNQIEKKKETFPYLVYNAVGDSSTCDICDGLDGITLPVDDEFWDTKMPPNHFNCQCLVEQIDRYEDVEETGDEEVEAAEEHADDHMQDEFQMNAGKDRIIFSDKHPYFDVGKKYRGFAEENFGLAIPEED